MPYLTFFCRNERGISSGLSADLADMGFVELNNNIKSLKTNSIETRHEACLVFTNLLIIMDISTIPGLSGGSEVAAAQGTVQSKKNDLGMDDFFKLLTTQLVSQNPLKPMQDTEFISQMASFSSLSQMEIIAENTAASKEQQEAAMVTALIGKHVEAVGPNEDTLSGKITRVESIDGELVPFMGDQQVPFKTITKITDGEKVTEPGNGGNTP